MLHNVFLAFEGNGIVTTHEQLFASIQNTFTIEFWVKPEATHKVDTESTSGISGTSGQRFAITPVYGAYRDGDTSRAGVGVSVGINGISVYEHTKNHLPATLAFKTLLSDWTHIAVVYDNKRPTLYVNGKFIKKGLSSTKKTVVPSGVFGGVEPYGFYIGALKEIRIWRTARKPSEIQQNMNRALTGKEVDLFGYWKLDEGVGVIANDTTKNGNNGVIEGAKWNTIQSTNLLNRSMNILFTFFVPSGGVETLNRQRFYALNSKGINCHFLYTQKGTGLQNKIDTSVFVTNDDDEIKNIILNGNYEAIVVGSDLLLLQKIKNFGYQGSLIYEIQGLGFNKEYADYFLKNHASSIINNYCDAILYPKTPHLIQAFENNFPFKKKFCFDNCFNSEEFRYQIHPKNDKPIIGWVGRIEENKNWKDFLLIGAELIKENPSIQLWMFEDNTLGEKSERIAFEQKIDELNLQHNLTIYANQPHAKMADHFSIIGDSGGFLCSTSKVEGFGYAVLEAMICRCPVLSTDSDGVRSFIKHNETGKFFELGNIHQAVKEAKELMLNSELREKIRLNGVKHIEEHFSPDKYAENFLNMLYNLKNPI
ncbi:glycosyltransferase [Bacillus sp. OTU530]|uniref:glycosyltransferase n=1 Tax=Bacillus sp. OTU530 TaxID=3043862 RepID=UPI00313B47E2